MKTVEPVIDDLFTLHFTIPDILACNDEIRIKLGVFRPRRLRQISTRAERSVKDQLSFHYPYLNCLNSIVGLHTSGDFLGQSIDLKRTNWHCIEFTKVAKNGKNLLPNHFHSRINLKTIGQWTSFYQNWTRLTRRGLRQDCSSTKAKASGLPGTSHFLRLKAEKLDKYFVKSKEELQT